MTRKITIVWIFLLGLVAAGFAQHPRNQQGMDPTDAKILQDVQHSLKDHPSFKNIQATVDDRIVTLNGTVESYYNKLRAARVLGHVDDNVQGVRDLLTVKTAQVGDQQLTRQLADHLRYDRVDEGIMFNNFTLDVHNGSVVIGGQARTPTDRDSALAIVENMRGVTNVIDNIKVLPTSFTDDELRIRIARAIYNDPSLQKYSIDPQAPIRIVVDNGHVNLAGVVDSPADKTIAETQAKSVPGVFSVQDNLVVAGPSSRASK